MAEYSKIYNKSQYFPYGVWKEYFITKFPHIINGVKVEETSVILYLTQPLTAEFEVIVDNIVSNYTSEIQNYVRIYNKSQYFPNGYSFTTLKNMIPPLTDITINNDTVILCFTQLITTEEAVIIDNIVSNYTRQTDLKFLTNINIPIVLYKIDSTIYQTITDFVYNGTNTEKTINRISLCCNSDTGLNSYTFRLYDITNNKTLAEQTFNNTNKEVKYIYDFVNIPTTQSILEFQVKIDKSNTNSAVNIRSINLYV